MSLDWWWWLFLLWTNHLHFKHAILFLYIFLQANYIVPPGAQNVARQLLILKATKFIAYTYYVSFY